MKFITTVALALALATGPARAQIIERVLVKVNGDIFTQTELEERQTAAIRARLGVDLKPEMVNDNAELKKALDEVRKNVEKQFLVSQVQRDEVGSKLTITEEEARQYYLSHKNEFVEPATVTLR